MGGSLAAVLAVGGTQLADAALTVLTDITLAVGSLVLLCTVLFVVLCLVATRGQNGPLTLAVVDDAEVGDDTLTMVCPCCNAWSDDCICTADCGVPRCQAADPDLDEKITRMLSDWGKQRGGTDA